MVKEAKTNKRYLTIHGHFYQPPRENPWLEEIEIQNSAYPFHDWNERINSECYKPNAYSKIFTSDNKILRMVNNYAKMSFNIGPTLMSWMQQKDKETYEMILEADRISMENNDGHGNAIAQVYNHIIMPLADEDDKDTQIKWGIEDFKNRFKRMPEGMWLAETGIDYKTIDKLIENGIKFTVLSPYQAKATRKKGEEEWQDVLGGKIDATRAYRCFSKTHSNKYLDIFFYDGPISNSIGFEDVLFDSQKYINRLKLALNSEATHNQLINVATDGETYGHHKKFADLTLAHLLFHMAEKEGFEVINYGRYLAKYPPVYEVEINEGKGEGTAWSCAHGVDRWKADCGCNTGGGHGNQKWREPLRNGLNELRDRVKLSYEREGSLYFKNPKDARNKYINVILDRKPETLNKFLKEVGIKEFNVEERINALKLLEMVRNEMLMFTSCGWFFDDISGIETQQLLRYAARVIQLAQEFTNEDLESVLLGYLANAKSNYEHIGTGKDIYINYVKPSIVTFDKVVAHYAITSLFEDYNSRVQIYTYEIEKEDSQKIVEGNLTLIVGKVKVEDLTTHEIRHMAYGMLRFGNTDFRCSVKNIVTNAEYFEIKREVVSKLEGRFSIVESMRGIDYYINRNYFTFKDLLLEEKRKILKRVTNKFFEDYKNVYEKLYFESARVIEALSDSGLMIPEEYKISAEYTVSSKISELTLNFLNNMNLSIFDELSAQVSNLKKWNYNVKTEKIEYKFRKKLNELTEKIADNDKESLENINKLYKASKILCINISTNYSQFVFYTYGVKKFGELKGEVKALFLEVAENMGFAKNAFS